MYPDHLSATIPYFFRGGVVCAHAPLASVERLAYSLYYVVLLTRRWLESRRDEKMANGELGNRGAKDSCAVGHAGRSGATPGAAPVVVQSSAPAMLAQCARALVIRVPLQVALGLRAGGRGPLGGVASGSLCAA